MLKIGRIVSTLSAAAILISGLVSVAPNDAWARGGGGRGGGGRVSVRGYYRSNGTYVKPHTRSAPGGSYGSYGTPYIPSSGYGSYPSPSTGGGYTTEGMGAGYGEDMFVTYMKLGYEASKDKTYDLALYWFEKALEYRPNNPYAVKAIQNVKGYMQRGW